MQLRGAVGAAAARCGVGAGDSKGHGRIRSRWGAEDEPLCGDTCSQVEGQRDVAADCEMREVPRLKAVTGRNLCSPRAAHKSSALMGCKRRCHVPDGPGHESTCHILGRLS